MVARILVGLAASLSALVLAPATGATPQTPAPCPGCWRPNVATTWQWQLDGPIDYSVDAAVYDIDGLSHGTSAVARLHSAGRHVLCYVDVGSWESWRADAGRFPTGVLVRPNGWFGERWLDFRRLAVLGPILRCRLDAFRAAGFDAVEPDNVDGYANRSGFPLTAADQLRYDMWIANAAHRRGLGVALKNDAGQVRALLPSFDFAVVEQCFEYSECSPDAPFVSAGKAVLEVEYRLSRSDFCPQARALGFSSLRKRLSLDAFRLPC